MALISHISITALAAKPASVSPREALFVDSKLNGKDLRIMVDIGATHNFVTEQKAKELGLSYVASKTKLKTVNPTPTTVHGFAPEVPIDLGDWTGQTDFTIAPMDVFDVILGLDFWYDVNAFISPRPNQLHISDTGDYLGLQERRANISCHLIEDAEICTEAVPMPPCIEQVLSNNKDVMPTEIPQRLPP
uniref:Uncharacterized protein n=1 Tax=Solanum lycopersicum TaxID=4081 RepID=A0A3Q7FHJ2_SOLLC